MTVTSKTQRRSGFTLVELLMVVAIIAILMTLTLVVMNGITEQAEEEATKTTVLKVSRMVDQRVEAFDRAFKGSRRDSYIQATIGLLIQVDGRFDFFLANPDKVNQEPALEALAYKAAIRFELPQRFVERTAIGEDKNSNGVLDGGEDLNGNGILDGPDNVPTGTSLNVPGMPRSIYERIALPAARQQWLEAWLEANPGGTPPTPADTDLNPIVTANWAIHLQNEAAALASDRDELHSTESAELLYFTLTQSGTFGSSSANLDQFTSEEIADTDGDSLPEFIDAWGHPLQFYRWPTRLFDPTAPNPFVPVLSDPVDPTDVGPGLREITELEREYAGLLVKGLPPAPTTMSFSTHTATQRDMMLVDPDDPIGDLYVFIESEKYKDMGIDLTQEINEAKYHTLDTYHTPLIVSAGADELLGLREPNNTDAPAGIYGNLAQYASTTVTSPLPSSDVAEMLFDNITNRNRRAGSRR